MENDKKFTFKNGDEPIILKKGQKYIKLTIATATKGNIDNLSINVVHFNNGRILKKTPKRIGSILNNNIPNSKSKKLNIPIDARLWEEAQIFVNSSDKEEYELFISYDNI